MTIRHINELFTLEGDAFINKAYQTLLGRAPDPEGHAFYNGRLARGFSKEEIIVDIATSPSADCQSRPAGTGALIKEVRRGQHWFWKWFTFDTHIKRAQNQNRDLLTRIAKNLEQLNHLNDLQAQLINNIAAKIATNGEDVITPNNVRDIYISLLQREPESEDIVKQYVALNNLQLILNSIISSDEFTNRYNRKNENKENIEAGLNKKNIFERIDAVYSTINQNIQFVEIGK